MIRIANKLAVWSMYFSANQNDNKCKNNKINTVGLLHMEKIRKSLLYKLLLIYVREGIAT